MKQFTAAALTMGALIVGIGVPVAAQAPSATGRVVGRVLDASSQTAVAGAYVDIPGSGLATKSAADGRYTLLRVPAGVVALRVRIIGYQPKTVSGVVVPDGGAVGLDVWLSPAEAVELEAVTVEAVAEQGSVLGMLETQRTSTTIVSAITAEQIDRSPDSDAGQAVQRVSGVTVQDGKYVFVRGLGERYTTTSLNGSRVPSPEPEKKVVPFDLFPADLVGAITTSKTFTPEQPGDFSGAQVDIQTREFPLRRLFRLSTSVGYNSAVTGRAVPEAPVVGTEWLGVAGVERGLPPALAEAGNLQGLSQPELNDIIASFRNTWSAPTATGSPLGSLGLSLGGEDPVFGVPVGYLGSLTYSFAQEARVDEQRALAVADGESGTRPQNEYRGETARVGVLWGGLLNLTARAGGGSKVSFNNTYTLSGDNEAIRLSGLNEEFAETFDITRLTFTERRVRSHQLAGEHLLGLRHTLQWEATASTVRRYEPDRSDLAYTAAADSVSGGVRPVMWWGGPRSAVRTFSDLDERALDLGGAYRVGLGTGSGGTQLKVGTHYRRVDRDADSRSYDIVNLGLDESARGAPAEDLFDGAYAVAGEYTLLANASGGRYTARDRVAAGFVQVELPVARQLQVVGGARVERADLRVDAVASSGERAPATLLNTDLLPSLALNYRATGTQVFRLSASRTLSRPEYRELAEVQYYDIIGGRTVVGNSRLRRATIENYDARWEWYPHAGEVLSVALFHKRFHDPIERIIVGTTGASTLSFVNAEGATNSGIELELRKALVTVLPALAPFSVFANVTLMQSDITPGADSVSALTSSSRPMVGQSEYVVNAGLAYAGLNGRATATLLYNVTGPRIVEAGQLPLPDAYEQARHLVDLSVEVPVLQDLSLKLDGKNLLDSPHEVTQGSVTRWHYRSGRIFALGVNWTP